MKNHLNKLLILSSIFFIFTNCFVFAEEVKSTPLAENWCTVINNLNEDEYGGAYLVDNILHIKPISNQEMIEMAINSSKSNLKLSKIGEIIIDDTVKYSVQELQEASDRVFAVHENLEIDSVGVIQKDNAILVGARNLSDEKKAEVCSVAAIDNVVFEEFPEYNAKPTEALKHNSNNIPVMRDPFEWFVGDPIKNWRGTMTLGACVKRGSIKGYITTAHHVAVGDKFTMGLNNNLGEVLSKNDVVYGGIADASFITRTIDSEFGMTNIVRLSNGTGYPKTGGLNYSGDPIIEGSVVTFGANGGRIYATIKSISYSTLASPEGTPPYTSFSRMILLDIGSSDKIDGDSGGPVMIDLTNQGLSGEYKLVGIYKGYDTNWNPIATRWDSIVSELDVQLY